MLNEKRTVCCMSRSRNKQSDCLFMQYSGTEIWRSVFAYVREIMNKSSKDENSICIQCSFAMSLSRFVRHDLKDIRE